MSIMYKQCLMEKGSSNYTAWIPKKFANKGKYLKIEGEDGWLIKEAYDLELDEEVVKNNSTDYEKQE
jgi:hypothetical protein